MCFTEYDHVVQALPADPSRLEAIAHHADEKEGDCDHQRGSCSDSGTAATPADGVFGSDSPPSSLVQSRIAVWTGDTRDTLPLATSRECLGRWRADFRKTKL